MIDLIRSLAFTIPLIAFVTLLMGTLSYFTAFFDPDGNRQHRLAQVWARMVLAISGVRVIVEGLENLEPGFNYVFASNHVSYMDTPVIIASIPAQFRFMAKHGLFKIPVMGGHLKRGGHLPVVRDDPRASLRSMAEAATTISKKQISVLLFPEGGRSVDGFLQPFREGAGYIAIKAGVPAVPVGLVGTRQVLPMHGKTIRGTDVFLRIGTPIPTASLTLKDRSALTDQLRSEVARLVGESVPQPQEAS